MAECKQNKTQICLSNSMAIARRLDEFNVFYCFEDSENGHGCTVFFSGIFLVWWAVGAIPLLIRVCLWKWMNSDVIW